MGSRVVLNCPICGYELFIDEELITVVDEETGTTDLMCERCERRDIESLMESSDWSV